MSKAKLLQYLSGLSASIYWFSTFLFDFCTYVITILIALATIYAFQEEGWSNLEQLEPVFVIFICFGFAALPLTYTLSHFFTTHSIGFIRLIVIYMLTGKFGICYLVLTRKMKLLMTNLNSQASQYT